MVKIPIYIIYYQHASNGGLADLGDGLQKARKILKLFWNVIVKLKYHLIYFRKIRQIFILEKYECMTNRLTY